MSGSDTDKGATLMIVEDEQVARNNWAKIFRLEGLEVIDAASGFEALEKTTTNVIDGYIVDIQMERPDGIDIATEFQANNPSAPIFFVTAFSEREDYLERVEQSKLRIADWLQKPVNGPELISIVKREIYKKKRFDKLIQMAKNLGVEIYDLKILFEEFSDLGKAYGYQESINEFGLRMSLEMPIGSLHSDPNFRTFMNQRENLQEKYKSGFVAFLDGKFVGHHEDWRKLIAMVHREYKRIDAFTAELDERPPLKFVSPRHYE